MSLGIAVRAFLGALFSRTTAQRIRVALESQSMQAASAVTASDQKQSSQTKNQGSGDSLVSTAVAGRSDAGTTAKQATKRSEAITLLSTLQREARLLDLICEPLDQFTDAQIGSAAREVLKDSRQTLDRLFSISPLADQGEGESMQLGSSQSAARVRLLGKSQGSQGVVVHRGWKASKCELPQWQGDTRDALVLMPTEVEVS